MLFKRTSWTTKSLIKAFSSAPKSNPIDTSQGRRLESVLDVPFLAHQPTELIKGLWNQENSNKENAFRFGRNISRDDYMVLKSRLEKAPRFIYPVGPEGDQNLMMTGYHYDNLLVKK